MLSSIVFLGGIGFVIYLFLRNLRTGEGDYNYFNDNDILLSAINLEMNPLSLPSPLPLSSSSQVRGPTLDSGFLSGPTPSTATGRNNAEGKCRRLFSRENRARSPLVMRQYQICMSNARNERTARYKQYQATHPRDPNEPPDDDSPCAAMLDNWQQTTIPANVNPQQMWQEAINGKHEWISKLTKAKSVGTVPQNAVRHAELLDGMIIDAKRALENIIQLGPINFAKRRLASIAAHQCNIDTGRWGEKLAASEEFTRRAEENFIKNVTLPDRD